MGKIYVVHDIVHVDKNFCPKEVVLIFDGAEYCVHHALKCCWGVHQPKEHDIGDIYSKFCFKHGFMLVLLLDAYVIVPLSNVEFHEYACILHGSYSGWY